MKKRFLLYSLIFIFFSITLALGSGCRPELDYTGDVVNGLPHGSGIMTYPNGAFYEGEFYNGYRSGKGTWEHPNGTTYVGKWQKDRYHGLGTLIIPGNFTYKGHWKHGVKHGYGIQTWNDNRRYEGIWYNGMMHGRGIMRYPDGSYYEGEWAENRKDGYGALHSPDGEITAGKWEKGRFIYIPVESIALCTDELLLTTNDPEYQLEAFTLPLDATSRDITWSSSNPEVATAVEGLITPQSAGEAVIIATAVAEALEAECILSVIKPPVRVTGVKINLFWLDFELEDDPVTLEAIIEPVDAANKIVNWTSSNPEVATVSPSGLVTPLKVGLTEITVTTADGGHRSNIVVSVR